MHFTSLVTKLTLQKREGLYYIVLQEDFYHPEVRMVYLCAKADSLIGPRSSGSTNFQASRVVSTQFGSTH
jgi:hypothetical protein